MAGAHEKWSKAEHAGTAVPRRRTQISWCYDALIGVLIAFCSAMVGQNATSLHGHDEATQAHAAFYHGCQHE